ncbi:MAG TPA: hypothetical protein VMV49_12555 [Candidatus Deferrimicrobium sp.]|nr:hypothetical protein [Candidatus Deferrimicrobium sp.]
MGAITEKLVIPVYRRWYRAMTGRECLGPFFRLVKFFEGAQWWSRERVERLRWMLLKALLNQAYENVPFYRKRFKTVNLTPADIRSYADFQKIPPLTRQDVQQNFPDQITARNIPKWKWIPEHTSGSIGVPLELVIGPRAQQVRRAG